MYKKLIMTSIILVAVSGCGFQLRSPVVRKKPLAEKLMETMPPREKILAYTMSGSNWLFSVLILTAVSGVVLTLALKIKEGIYVAIASVGGIALIVAFARWGWLIGLLTIVLVMVVMLSKIKVLQDVGIFAVKYAENLKKKLPADKVREFNEDVYQPPPVKSEIKEIRNKK